MWPPCKSSIGLLSNVSISALFPGGPLDARPGYHHGVVGARRPDQLQPVDDVIGWSLDASAKAEIDRILSETTPIRLARNSWRRRHAASQVTQRNCRSDDETVPQHFVKICAEEE